MWNHTEALLCSGGGIVHEYNTLFLLESLECVCTVWHINIYLAMYDASSVGCVREHGLMIIQNTTQPTPPTSICTSRYEKNHSHLRPNNTHSALVVVERLALQHINKDDVRRCGRKHTYNHAEHERNPCFPRPHEKYTVFLILIHRRQSKYRAGVWTATYHPSYSAAIHLPQVLTSNRCVFYDVFVFIRPNRCFSVS